MNRTKKNKIINELVKEAVDDCADYDLLDLIYKLLLTDQKESDTEARETPCPYGQTGAERGR